MLKKILDNIIRTVQAVLMAVLLTFVYFIGLGITLFFMLIFNRKVLTGPNKNDKSFWIEACGYDADINDSLRQS